MVLAPAPPTQWFPCPQCRNPVPVVVPRDLPPLYSWEVLPGLYPTLPSPRRPKVRIRRAAQAALVGLAVIAIVLAAVFAVFGAEALGSGHYVVSGTIVLTEPPHDLIAPTTVVLTTDSGQQFVNRTVDGSFAFSNVPAGGITVNVTKPGYAPVTVYTFASDIYNAGTNLSITLTPGTVGNGTTVSLTPFPDLESFVASLGSGAVILGLVGVLGGAAAAVTRRSDRPAVGVVGGFAGVLSPVAVYFLALGGIFPFVTAGTALLAAFGAFTVVTRGLELFQSSPESVTP